MVSKMVSSSKKAFKTKNSEDSDIEDIPFKESLDEMLKVNNSYSLINTITDNSAVLNLGF